jgi:hypothetical protein
MMNGSHAQRQPPGLPQLKLGPLVRSLSAVWSEHALVALALGVMAVHVLDDPFLVGFFDRALLEGAS